MFNLALFAFGWRSDTVVTGCFCQLGETETQGRREIELQCAGIDVMDVCMECSAGASESGSGRMHGRGGRRAMAGTTVRRGWMIWGEWLDGYFLALT